MDQLNIMRAEVAREHGITLYAQYNEQRAAHFLKLDLSTVRRNRRAGRVPYVQYGNGGVRFLGVMLCDYILFGADAVRLWGGETPDEGQAADAAE
ncbi:hypothetical protein [Methylorubrum sp. SB2]|uniref:hypothetical protein n=1 Tax=Methylorubrum subtropicum TaxID=3138812 RepID=UPI00313C6411